VACKKSETYLQLKTVAVNAGILMGSIHGTFHYAGVTGNMAFISSEILTLGLRMTAERVRNWPQEKEITNGQIR
jgi:hypothetical protein